MEDQVIRFIERLIDKVPGWVSGPILVSIAIGVAISFLRFVKEAEQGVILRFGKARRTWKGVPIIKYPGFIIVLPKIDQLITHHTREQPLDLEPQEVILKDGSIFRVKAVVFFRIFDVYKALFEVSNPESAIQNLCGGELREVLQNLEGVNEIKNVEMVNSRVLAACKVPVSNWGSHLVRFKLIDCKPSQETSAAVTAPTLVAARVEALKRAGIADNPMLSTAVLGAPTVAAVTERIKPA